MQKRAPRGASGRPCLPAAELEEVEREELRGLLRTSGMLGDVVTRAVDLDRTLDEAQVTVTMTRLDEILGPAFSGRANPHRTRLLGEKVMVSPHDTEVRLRQTLPGCASPA